MDAQKLAEMHKATQEVANEAFGLCAIAVQLAAVTGKALKQWEDSLPDGSDAEKAAQGVLSDDLQAWYAAYQELAALKYGEPFNETKPSVMQKAMKLLDLIPQTVTKKENENEDDKVKA